MHFTAKQSVLTLAAASALAMLYVGAYQIRAVEHLSCPLFKGGCEAVADAPFARPFGIPDGFIAAAIYGVVILLALFGPQEVWARYSLRGMTALAVVANILGVFDMLRFGAYCFYCLLTTALSPFLLWAAFLV